MSEVLIVIWFLCGIAAHHLIELLDIKEGTRNPNPAWVCWVSLFGPVILLMAILVAIDTAINPAADKEK
jgi:hypothetical protein